MVAKHSRNTLCRNRRDQRGERCDDHRGGRRFYRDLVRRVGLRRRRSISHLAFISALPIILGPLVIPVNASPPNTNTAPSLPSITANDFSSALSAYESGNTQTALTIASSLARQGDSRAMVLAGRILMLDTAQPSNQSQAIHWLREAAKQENADAYMALGETALKSQAGLSPSDALHWFSKASQMQRADAKRVIGEMYIKGQGIAPDVTKGRDWLEQAHDAQDSLAARKLGDSWFDSNPNEALSWYEKAAIQGDHEAAYIAAIMLAENLDVRPDSARQASLLRRAALGGHAAGMADYGLLVYQGAGAKQSNDQAADWFRKSAEAGDPEGQFLYAFTLAKGEGVQQSYEDAYYWLLKSGESSVSAYQKDRQALRERLEKNVDPAILERARVRIFASGN